jgi:non-ribosomal peptide synthetase-like protein
MALDQVDTADWVLSGPSRPDLVRNESLVDIFAVTAARLPAKPALSLIGTDRSLTYRALDEAASAAARALVANGVEKGEPIGLWFRRSLDQQVAMLAVLKAGGVFIPFDAAAPVERVRTCLANCGARRLLTHAELGPAPDGLGVNVVTLDSLVAAGAHGTAALPAVGPDDLAYVIYTSGSTGTPKGIVVSHRNVCHYVRAVNERLAIRETDVVLQQASLAFDLSLEEILVAYLVGATQKVATDSALGDIDALAATLEREQVTVIDAVPTFVQMLSVLPSTVRLVVVGGEACPAALVERVAASGCRLLNTYGPTETTVVATAGELAVGEAVSIGTPLPNYSAYVVNSELAPCRRGEVGELLVGGPSVALGYVGLPELSAAKFIANPFATPAASDPVLYRTGDAVSIDERGRLLFHGRIDLQVKIRGYRIELGEIEAAILGQGGVRAAAVVPSPHGSAGDVLVAHVVADREFSETNARTALAARLPTYMQPTFWQQHADLPQLASGKIDRKALAALPLSSPAAAGEQEAPGSLTEAHLLRAAREVLGLPVVALDADFFADLGGHSLLAARFVSEVRKSPHLASIALKDVYCERTLRRLAAVLDERARSGGTARESLEFPPPPLSRRLLCGLAQAAALPFIIAIVTAQWIGLLLASIYLVREDAPFWLEALTLCSVYVALNLGAKLTVIALKWLVIGRTRPGVYPLWGAYYFRIWLMQRLVHLTAHKFLQGSPLMRLYLRALGADIGRDAIIQEFEEGAVDLISIGARASIGAKVRFANVEVIGNEVHVGGIEIGAGAQVGNASVIAGNVTIGAGAELADLTLVGAGACIGMYERWEGTPARFIGYVNPTADLPHPEIGGLARAAQTIGYFIAYNLVMMVGLLPIFPAFYILAHMDALTFGDRDMVVPWEWVLLLAWPAALALVFASMLLVVAMRWMLFPRRVVPGRHSIYSGFYFRKWVMGLATEAMLETLNSLYATVFMRSWYRLMGTKVGSGTEISANFSGRYDLIELGANNFVGDETIFGDEEVRNGWMTLDRVRTGDRCFFGNLSVVAKGAIIEDDALIGVKSRLPESLHVGKGETWFGSPAIAMPNRQRLALSADQTYQPPPHMRVLRTLFEALHTSFPTAVLISLAYITADVIEFPIDAGDWVGAAAIFLVAGVAVSLVMLAISVVFKWIAMGVYRPRQAPMWSWWAMRTEAVSVLYGGLSSKVMLDYVRGTPFMPWLLRLYGVRIGRGCWINCADLTEFDCVTIGDFAVLNMHANAQTHLYEDRVMKVGRIRIGRGATIGSGAIVLYDTDIGDWAQIEPLTVVMKGETVPAHTAWCGAPSRRVVARWRPALEVATEAAPAAETAAVAPRRARAASLA